MENNNFYHILNRGVEKRKIFLNKKDYLRFLHNIEDFNDNNITLESYYNRRVKNYNNSNTTVKKPLVDVICWCLMPNHFHILVKENIDKGASLFSMKNTNGFTKYFNSQNKRSGVLFQGKSKIIFIEEDMHFNWLPFYILSNPLDLFQSDWREKGVKEPKKSLDFLINYEWSNLSSFFYGPRRSVEVNNFLKVFDTTAERFKSEFEEWLINYKGGFDFGDFED